MGNLVLQHIPGLTWPIGRTTNFKTLTASSLSNRVANLPIQQYATYTYSHVYELLRDDITVSEIKALVGLFNACRGRFDSFLYSDPAFNQVTAEPFGTGDGTTVAFQVLATFQNSAGPGRADIIQNFNGTPSFFNNGTLITSGVTLGPTGILTFTTPPVAAHALTWTGQFYQRCHFLNDTFTVQRFMNKWWQADQFTFQSVLL